MNIFKSVEDCPLVEAWIWDKVASSFGDFEGVRELSENDLWQLKSTVDCQLQQMQTNKKDT